MRKNRKRKGEEEENEGEEEQEVIGKRIGSLKEHEEKRREIGRETERYRK